jgi:hypothetical protein
MGATPDDCSTEPTNKEINELTCEEETLVAIMEDIIQFFLDLLQVTGCNLDPKNACGTSSTTDEKMAYHPSYRYTNHIEESI